MSDEFRPDNAADYRPQKRNSSSVFKSKSFLGKKIFGNRLGRDKKFRESRRSVRRTKLPECWAHLRKTFALTLPDILENLTAQFNVQFTPPWDRSNSFAANTRFAFNCQDLDQVSVWDFLPVVVVKFVHKLLRTNRT